MTAGKIPSTQPYFSSRQRRLILRSTLDILRTGRLILGPYTEKLERGFGGYIGSPYAVAVSSCTAAMEIVLRWIGVAGREVIVPTNTFVASVNAVIFAGGRPVLADIDADSLCLSLRDTERKISRETKAVILVHIAGIVHPRVESFRDLCRRRKIFLIEDVAHATGASIGAKSAKKAGGFGDAGCFSFYPTKVMTTGAGGMITTRHRDLAEFAVSLRHHGAGRRGGLTDVQRLGNDWLMDEFRAGVGLAQLADIESMIAARRRLAKSYSQAIRGMAAVKAMEPPKHIRHVYYKYPVVTPDPQIRRRLVDTLKSHYGIDTGSIYLPPVHRQPYHARALGLRPENFPEAEDILPRILCLPVYPQMTQKDQKRVLGALREVLSRLRR